MQHQSTDDSGIRPWVLLAIVALVAVALVGAFGETDEQLDTGEATFITDCTSCEAGAPIRFSGEGYPSDLVTIEMAELEIVAPVSADGSIRLDWPGFVEPGTYEITVYRGVAEGPETDADVLASLTLEIGEAGADRTAAATSSTTRSTSTTEPEPTTTTTEPIEVPATVPDVFSPDSYWNTPLAPDAPVHPNSDRILEFLRADNNLDGCIQFAGVPGNDWGMPVYLSGPDDPVYDVIETNRTLPPEFSSLRIPVGAQAADTSDGEMVIYDFEARVVAQLSKARYEDGEWFANGGSIAYMDSNGLDSRLAESDEPRNIGTFRGYPGAVAMVHYDDVASGELDNVVKIGVNNAHPDFVFPMVGSDGDTDTSRAPLEGTRIRIKPDVDLRELGLTGHALIIAEGLQKYGMIVGDKTGGGVVLKLEDTEHSGRGSNWDLERDSLCAITTDDLEVLALP